MKNIRNYSHVLHRSVDFDTLPFAVNLVYTIMILYLIGAVLLELNLLAFAMHHLFFEHINYLGEVLMAVGLTLALGYPWLILPWLYPLYYIIFLVTRERDDDKRCAGKYGALWDEYQKVVPWRIIPRVY